MKIDLSHLQDTASKTFRLSEPIQDKIIPAAGPVDLQLTIIRSDTDVFFTGTCALSLNLECSRCLIPFVHRLTIPFETHMTVDFEIDPVLVDIFDDVRQTIILSLPEKSLCRSDCHGICGQCGTNRNESACGCQPDGHENRLNILKKYKFKK